MIATVNYIQGRPIIGNIIFPITRYLRAVNVGKYIKLNGKLLDIGCGDKYFINRQKINCIGIDRLYGTKFVDKLNFEDETFDYVTMLAVIEHIQNVEQLFSEVHRVLKPNGKFIFTTPKKQAEWIFRLYAKDIDSEHESYFDLKRVYQLTKGRFTIEDYQTFIFGLNQVFCLRRIK